MDETKRRLEIAKELFTWAGAIPRLLVRIGEVLKMSNLTEAQRIDIEQMAHRIGALFTKIGEMADAEPDNKVMYEQLIAGVDRLREEISIANTILDKLLNSP